MRRNIRVFSVANGLTARVLFCPARSRAVLFCLPAATRQPWASRSGGGRKGRRPSARQLEAENLQHPASARAGKRQSGGPRPRTPRQLDAETLHPASARAGWKRKAAEAVHPAQARPGRGFQWKPKAPRPEAEAGRKAATLREWVASTPALSVG